MKILAGIILALVIALFLTGWQLKSSWTSEAETRQELAGVTFALKTTTQQNADLMFRLGTFDEALGRLQVAVTDNQTELTKRLSVFQNMTEEPTDEPQSFACLDIPVPAQLDHGLREPETAGR